MHQYIKPLDKKDDSLGSPETEISRSPSSYKKRRPSALIDPMVSNATGIKMCVCLMEEYLERFLVDAASPASPGVVNMVEI